MASALGERHENGRSPNGVDDGKDRSHNFDEIDEQVHSDDLHFSCASFAQHIFSRSRPTAFLARR